MKQEFIKKWKSWWMLQKQGAELTDAFERELNAIIEQEVASKNLVKPLVSGIGGVIRTERGWAGHFICANRCKFRRNGSGL